MIRTKNIFTVCLFIATLFSAAVSGKGIPELKHTMLNGYDPFPKDTIFYCGADSVLLDALTGYQSYVWNTGDTAQTIPIATTGKYHVTVTDAQQNTFSDTVFVSVIRYQMNGYSTQTNPFLTDYEKNMSATPLQIGAICSFDCEVLDRYFAYAYWKAPEDGEIDSLGFEILSYEGDDNGGSVDIYEYNGSDTCFSGYNGNFIKTVQFDASITGLRTIPVHFAIRKGAKYRFEFAKGYFDMPQIKRSLATLRVGNYNELGGCDCPDRCRPAVWMQLSGTQKIYDLPGNQYYSCHSDSVVLNTQPAGDYIFNWTGGATTPSIKVMPDQTTTYWVTIANDFHQCSDSTVITVFNYPFNPFTTDTIFACTVSSFPLEAKTEGYAYYSWNTGNGSSLQQVNSDGWYKVTTQGGKNCIAVDSVYVVVSQGPRKSYWFIGDGLYSDAANWELYGPNGGQGKPPTVLGPKDIIYIKPSGTCIMDVEQIVYGCSIFHVMEGKTIIIQGNLQIKNQVPGN